MIAFRYDAAVDSTWHAYTYDAATASHTDVNTGVTPDTNFHQFAIQTDGSGGWNFYIDGTKVANIPSSGRVPASTVQMGDLIQIDAAACQVLRNPCTCAACKCGTRSKRSFLMAPTMCHAIFITYEWPATRQAGNPTT